MTKKKWIQKALNVKPRRRTRKAAGYTAKGRHHYHRKTTRVEAAHKGALHRWAKAPMDYKFTKSDLRKLEHHARAELKAAHVHGSHHAQEEALHNLRMVLFAKNVRGLRHHHGPRHHAYGTRRAK